MSVASTAASGMARRTAKPPKRSATAGHGDQDGQGGQADRVTEHARDDEVVLDQADG